MKKLFAVGLVFFMFACGGAGGVDPPPATASAKSKASPQIVTWIQVGNGEQFWQTIKQNDKNVALIGTEICPPCEAAKAWWESRRVPPGWQFVYWRIGRQDDLLTNSFRQVFLKLQNQDNLTLPYLSIIEDAEDPQKIKKITATFRSFGGCTREADDFLRMHPHGTLRF
mgnify:CR=1 FL=1